MRKSIILLAILLAALMCSCKEEPVTPTETGTSYVRTSLDVSEVWYFDKSGAGLFEHYDLQGSIKVPLDNGWWEMKDKNLLLTCRGTWCMYSATTEGGIRLDFGGNSYEMKGSDGVWRYSDGVVTCVLTVGGSEGADRFTLELSDSWHRENYSGKHAPFKGIDQVYTADSKKVVHLDVTMSDNLLEIDGNRFSKM